MILEDGPTWHTRKQNTPTMGGVIFMIAMTLAVLTTLPTMIAQHDWRPLVMLGLSLVFGFIGMVDDWTKIKKKHNKGLTALQKLLLQIAAAVLFLVVMRGMGYLNAHLYIPFVGVTLRLPWLLYLLFSVIVILGADNAVNLTDGIDGLCASVTFVVALFFSVVVLRETPAQPLLRWHWLAACWAFSCSTRILPGYSWATPVLCSWAVRYALWPLPMICR